MSTTGPKVLDTIVKAYDVRGTVPDQLNIEVARALGVGFAKFVNAPRILVGRDMRPSGPELVEAFVRGVNEQGVDVVDLGLTSTDLVYFAAGSLDAPGAMFTASHNPAQYNGVKFCLAGARAVGQDTGLATIKSTAFDVLSGNGPAPSQRPGSTAARSCHAAAPSLPQPDTAPRSVWLADNSAPATRWLLPAASCPPSLSPSPQPDSVPCCSIPFSPIGVPPVGGTLNGDISTVVARGQF